MWSVSPEIHARRSKCNLDSTYEQNFALLKLRALCHRSQYTWTSQRWKWKEDICYWCLCHLT